MSDQIISKLEARITGLQWYFTGRSCLRGHVTLRSVASGKCRDCDRERSVARYIAIRLARPPKLRLSELPPEEQLAHKRAQWRESFRRINGSRPLEEIRAEQKIRREAKEQERLAKAAERAARRATLKDRQRAYREANRDRNLKLQKDWREANREKRRVGKRASKIAKRKTTIADLSKLQRGRCAICAERLGSDLHLDHIMPRKLGGSNERSNLQLTCAPCNMAKHAKHPLDFARMRGMLL